MKKIAILGMLLAFWITPTTAIELSAGGTSLDTAAVKVLSTKITAELSELKIRISLLEDELNAIGTCGDKMKFYSTVTKGCKAIVFEEDTMKVMRKTFENPGWGGGNSDINTGISVSEWPFCALTGVYGQTGSGDHGINTYLYVKNNKYHLIVDRDGLFDVGDRPKIACLKVKPPKIVK